LPESRQGIIIIFKIKIRISQLVPCQRIHFEAG
jgi:hypothetical protein